MIKSERCVDVTKAAEFLELPEGDVITLVNAFVQAGTIQGDWETDSVFKVEEGLGEFLEELDGGFAGEAPKEDMAMLLDHLTRRIEETERERQQLDSEKSALEREVVQLKSGRVLVLGLDQAGKTSLLRTFKEGETFSDTEQPTLGIDIVKLVLKEITLLAYDVGGQRAFRQQWVTTLRNPNAIIYVIDIAEKKYARVKESREEFMKVRDFVKMHKLACPVLIVGNKLDKVPDVEPEAKIQDLSKQLKLHKLKGVPQKVFLTSAKTGKGVVKAFQWLISEIIHPSE